MSTCFLHGGVNPTVISDFGSLMVMTHPDSKRLGFNPREGSDSFRNTNHPFGREHTERQASAAVAESNTNQW